MNNQPITSNGAAPQPLLEVENLRVYFPIRTGFFSSVSGHVRAVDGVSLRIAQGETLGLVGESGCGKNDRRQGDFAAFAAGRRQRQRQGTI